MPPEKAGVAPVLPLPPSPMYPCPSCGEALPESQPPLPFCPHCGFDLTYEEADAFASSPGAPPGFGDGSPYDSTDEQPIFGMPGESSSEMRRPESLAPLRRRQPPPKPPGPEALLSGPPSIGLEDLARHGELDLGGSTSSLQLDHARTASESLSEPPPEIAMPEDSGLEFLTPVDLDGDDAGVDLPSPVSASRGSVQDDSNAYVLDLLAPVQSASPAPFARPAAPPVSPPPSFAPPGARPPASPASPPTTARTPASPAPSSTAARAPAPTATARTPAPTAARAPAPPAMGPAAARAPAPPAVGPAAARTPAPPAAAPAAARSPAPPAARPATAPPPAAPSARSVPRPAAPPPELPSFDDDLPVPVELDLPTPVFDDRLDLPIPVDLEADPGQMLAPVDLDVMPIELGVTPAQLDVTPIRLDVQPKLAGNEVAPHDLPAVRPERAPVVHQLPPPVRTPSGPVAAATGPSKDKPKDERTPTLPSDTRRKPISRGVLFGGGGLLLVGLIGAGILYSGVLDPEDPQPQALRGVGTKPAPKPDGEVQQPDPKVTPSSTLAERSPVVLAKLAVHTPEAYIEAIAASQAAGDAVGVAEGALLLALHYGPNPVRVAEASAALSPHASEKASFVARVVGLAALVAGDHAGAEAMLTGEEPRARLYRGWLRLAQGRLDEAKAEAEAVLSARPDVRAARELVLVVQAERDPVAAVPTIQAALEQSPHPALRALLAAVATEAGQLALARTTVDGLDPAATEDPGVQAWTHVQKARVLAAQGDLEGALAGFDRALELVPQQPAVQFERVRMLVAAKRSTEASVAASALVRERPKDPEAKLLQAEVAIQNGDGDIALQLLGDLATALPKDVRVSVAKGEVHAMRFEVEDGRAAFAAARELDATDVRAAVGEAVLLADAKRLPEALAVLETARAAAEAAGRSRDVARLWIAKGKLHAKASERNAALEAYDRALEAAPGDNEAQLRRGLLRLEAGELAEGRADLVELFERTGGYPGLVAPLARLYVRDSDYEALERLVGARLHGETTADELVVIGARLRLHQGRSSDARTLLELALARHPSDWEAHMLLAQVLILEGNASEALAEIERSRPPTPEPEQMLQRGKILEFNGRHDDAIPEYQRALAIDPELYEARFLYGRMLHYKGGHSKAIAELRKVLDQPRAKATAWYPEVWLNIGVAQQAQGKHEEAIASLAKATALDPKLGEAWANAGKFHGDRNEHGKAIVALEKAIEIGPKDAHWYPNALMDLGRSQSKAGKKADAKKSLTEFLKVAPPENTSRAEAERLLGEL